MKAKRINYIDDDGQKHNLKDLTNCRFGRLVVLCVVGVDKRRGAIWKCRCDCGNEVELIGSKLTTGTTKSCGCLQSETARLCCYKNHKHNLSVKVGDRYGKLTVLEVRPRKKTYQSALCLCQCDCGSEPKWIDSHSLRRGNTTSCGCIVSKGENKINQLLRENSIRYQTQKTFEDCVNPHTNTKLRFDFYLPDYNCCIAYDGEQHYKTKVSSHSYFTEEALSKIKYRDKIKDNYCLSRSIRLIRIPYTEYNNLTFPYIQDILDKKDNRFDVKGLTNA